MYIDRDSPASLDLHHNNSLVKLYQITVILRNINVTLEDIVQCL
jgi:hypothetical protein